MTDNIIAFDFNGVKVVRDTNTKLIRLTQDSTATSSVTFHNTADASNYQVPTGKKATIIFVESFDVNILGGVVIGFADDADGNTNAVTLLDHQSLDAISNLLFISAEVPAEKFINTIQTSGSALAAIMFIVEENA